MTLRSLLAMSLLAPAAVGAQQVPDNSFDVSVAHPTHVTEHPRMVLDEAHNNFHTTTGRYAPWAALMRNDGVEVSPGKAKFSAAALKGVDVLVIANAVAPGMAAGGATAATATSAPVFTKAECDVVRAWVDGGGSLLLISDHAPFGSAAEILANQFGVDFGKGFVYDVEHHAPGGGPTMLMFEKDQLGEHPIISGRDSTERIHVIYSFTGQSLSIPSGATALMKLSRMATEAPNRVELAAARGKPADGRAQGIAMPFGKGRVVMLGEAAMMSAQLAGGRGGAGAGGEPRLMGMNFPGSDDKQFALNVERWLTGVLK